MGLQEDLLIEEYKALRQEHENNRKFIFERPIVVALGIVAGIGHIAADNMAILPYCTFLALLLLSFTIAFTFDRVQSGARITAYLQLLHETRMGPWHGWETNLCWYRNDQGNGKSARYYSYIWWFVMSFGFVITTVSACVYTTDTGSIAIDLPDTGKGFMYGLLFVVFAVLMMFVWQPNRITMFEQKQSDKWLAAIRQRRCCSYGNEWLPDLPRHRDPKYIDPSIKCLARWFCSHVEELCSHARNAGVCPLAAAGTATDPTGQ
jgi:uncharacterized membrane protein